MLRIRTSNYEFEREHNSASNGGEKNQNVVQSLLCFRCSPPAFLQDKRLLSV